MILPRQLLLIPQYLVAQNLALTQKFIGVILTSVAPAFGIFLCRQFMQSIPTELIESAEIDGYGEIGKFVNIILPLSVPAVGALSIFTFLGVWNDFLWQFIMLSNKRQTVPVGISIFSQVQARYANYGYQLAGALAAIIPVIVIFLFFQRFFIKGITMGSIKG
jgi:multiple sugar transport system permease protein